MSRPRAQDAPHKIEIDHGVLSMARAIAAWMDAPVWLCWTTVSLFMEVIAAVNCVF